MKLHSILIAVVLLFSTCLISSPQTSAKQTNNAAAVTEIQTYVTQIDGFTKKQKFRTYGVAYENDKEIWKPLKRKEAEESFESCDVWTREGDVVLAFCGFTSSSGDWYHFIKYYYRADGTLAKIQARLNTFYGGVSVLRDRYYDGNGKLLKSTQRFLDLQTHKPTRKKDFGDMEIPMYARVSALPFHKLL